MVAGRSEMLLAGCFKDQNFESQTAGLPDWLVFPNTFPGMWVFGVAFKWMGHTT